MKKHFILFSALALLPLYGACGDHENVGPQKEANNNSNNSNHKDDKDDKPDSNTDHQSTDTPHDGDSEDDSTDKHDSESDENTDQDIIPQCPSDVEHYAGCTTIAGTDWIIECVNGTLMQQIKCLESEECFEGEENYLHEKSIYCKEKIPTEFNDICANKGDASFCKTVGNNSWSVVCTENQLYTGSYGTTNCTSQKLFCNDSNGYSECICKQNSDCTVSDPSTMLPLCNYGFCSFECTNGFTKNRDYCEPDDFPENATVINFDFIKNTTVDAEDAGAYTTTYTYKNVDYLIDAVGRTNLSNTENGTTTDYSIDGNGIIIRTAKDPSSRITLSQLTKGVGMVGFDAFGWDSGNVVVTLVGTDEEISTTQTIKAGQRIRPQLEFNNTKATAFMITSMGRIVIDNLAWTESATESATAGN